MQTFIILLLTFIWLVVANGSKVFRDARNLKWSLTDDFIIHAANDDHQYYIHFLPKGKTFRVLYRHSDLDVYSVCGLIHKSENNTFSIVQIAKNMTSNHIILSRVTFNLTIKSTDNRSSSQLTISEMSHMWTREDDTQEYIFLKVDSQERYVYVLADSFIFSYDMSTNKIDRFQPTNGTFYDSKFEQRFIPYALDVTNEWAVIVGLQVYSNSKSLSYSIVYFFNLPSLTLRCHQQNVMDEFIKVSDILVYNPHYGVSVSINPSATLVAIGYTHIETVTIHQMCHQNIHYLRYQGPPGMNTSGIGFGRSVAWLDDQGTLAVLVDKSVFSVQPQSEIHVYKNIFANSSFVSRHPDFILPNNQQEFELTPYRSSVFIDQSESDSPFYRILARSNSLLILNNEIRSIYFRSAEVGYSMSAFTYEEPFYIIQSNPCVSGTYKNVSDIGPCTVCPTGTKNPGVNISIQCQSCQIGSFCPLGASNDVNISDFQSHNQTFNLPDLLFIDNYDDLLVLNFLSIGKYQCLIISPLFWALLALIFCVTVWLIMFFIKIRQPTSVDTYRKRVKVFFKHIDIIGEGERWIGGLASFAISILIAFSCWFAYNYLHLYPYKETTFRELCGDDQQNTKLDSALQLLLPESNGQYWEIFHLLDEQKFTMIVYLINTRATCSTIDVQLKRVNGSPLNIPIYNCTLSTNSVTGSFYFELPSHATTIEIGITGGYFIGALRLCLRGVANNRIYNNAAHILHELDSCTLFRTEGQTIGFETDFTVHLIKVINVTKPLEINDITRYDGRWTPMIKYTDELSDKILFENYGQYLRYVLNRTKFTVRLAEENYFAQNNQSPIIRRNALIFHTLLFFSLLIEMFTIVFLLYKLCCWPLIRRLLSSHHIFLKHELQQRQTENAIDVSSVISFKFFQFSVQSLSPSRFASKCINAQSTKKLEENPMTRSNENIQSHHCTSKINFCSILIDSKY